MNIRHEDEKDITRISELQYAAFKGHPQHAPGAEPLEHKIVERLRKSDGLALSLVAELDEELVGHIALSEATLGEAGQGWLLLGPIGVLPERQGRGIGSALIWEALRLLRQRGASGVVLVGVPGYYGRFGFSTFSALAWSGVPPSNVLALPFGKEEPEGNIKPHSAFFDVMER